MPKSKRLLYLKNFRENLRFNVKYNLLLFIVALCLIFILCPNLTLFFLQEAAAKDKDIWAGSPLAPESRSSLEKAGRSMKSGKYAKAKPVVLSVLEQANDVAKCLAIAEYTEPWAYPMLDTRRQCCDKALSLCSTDDDFLLVALKARKYQFFEVTRQAIHSLIANAKTMPQLYDLAKKAHEVTLSDVCHLALEKAYTGLKTQDQAYTYADIACALGMDDLLRRSIKQMIDDEDDSLELCNLALRIQKYAMRDLNRYALRKAMDKTSKDLPTATKEMYNIGEVARRLNEPDVKNRAEYFVKKGGLMIKQRQEKEEHDEQLKAERERLEQEKAAAAASGQFPGDKKPPTSFGASNPEPVQGSQVETDERASSGY